LGVLHWNQEIRKLISQIGTIYQQLAECLPDRYRSSAEVGKEPQKQAQADTEEKAGDDRKVKGGVFATMHDVSGEAAETEGELGAEAENGAEEDQESAEEKERAAELAKGVHSEILTPSRQALLRSTACYI
jgi:hypothetical protein